MSKLLHSRRIRFTTRNDVVNDPDLDSSLPEPYSHRRSTTNRHHHRRRHVLPCRLHPHHLSEHEEGVTQLQSGSIIIRQWGANENNRLPGVVLLAKERLLERLRGIHISQNRQNTRSLINIHQDDFSLPMSSMIKTLPSGLSKHEVNGLKRAIFNDNVEGNNETSRECSICLEGFEHGDEVINLACMHRFHSCCLIPWIEVCGACPNCRKDVVVSCN